MISYVLVLIESLATGQLTHAYLEGPMSESWCERLIERDGYVGEDLTSRRLPSCVSWPHAQQMLLDHLCRQRRGPGLPWRRHFDCEATVPTAISTASLAPAAAPIAAFPTQSAMRSTQPEPDVLRPPTQAHAEALALPSQAQPQAPALPEQPSYRPAQRQFHLGTAAAALVAQAQTQAGGGNYELAAATIERALRIEPENPLVWVELGRLRLRAGEAAQADGIERKALALASGDGPVQGSAWRLIAESLRARGRNQEAAEADHAASSLSAQ